MLAAGSVRETKVAANVDLTWLNGCMIGIQACPISTKMTKVPLFIDESINLLFCHLVIC